MPPFDLKELPPLKCKKTWLNRHCQRDIVNYAQPLWKSDVWRFTRGSWENLDFLEELGRTILTEELIFPLPRFEKQRAEFHALREKESWGVRRGARRRLKGTGKRNPR